MEMFKIVDKYGKISYYFNRVNSTFLEWNMMFSQHFYRCVSKQSVGLCRAIDSGSACWSQGSKFESQLGHIQEIDHAIISLVIFSLPLQKGQLSVTGESG